MKKKVEVKLLKGTKYFDSLLADIDGTEKFREERLKRVFGDFENYLLNNAIMLKCRVIFVVNYTKSEKLEDGIRNDVVFKAFATEDAAREFLSQAKKEDYYASMCDYHFDRLLLMSDIDFDGLPDLGNKDLALKYRNVMRDSINGLLGKLKDNKDLQKFL